ncbi:uncharacterized protein LOC120332670 [Styela clava]
MKALTSRAVKIAFTVIAFVVFAISFVFSFLGNVPVGVEKGNATLNAATDIFINTIPDLATRYPTAIQPAPWVFVVIWPIIFLWNTVGIFYLLASLCLPKDRSPILREPSMFPVESLIFWCLSWGCSMGWIFAFDRELLGLSMFLILVAAWSTYATLGLSYRSYYSDILILEEHSHKMLLLVRIIIHNGFAILAAWLTCAWKITLATTITYKDSSPSDEIPAALNGSITSEDAGTIGLSILLFELVLWFVLENFVFEPYCRYTLSIYPTLIFALSGVFSQNYVSPFSRNLAITLAALILAIFAFIARIVLVIYRHRHRTRYA